MAVNKKTLLRDHNEIKNFGYQKEGVRLNFSLNFAKKNEVDAFVEMLNAALYDIEQETNKQSL